MTEKRIKSILNVTFIASFFTILFSLLLFYSNFRSQSLSDKISDWASFGDYFGGVTNTIISLLSLIILSFLTHLVSKQSSEEEKENNILIRRMDAYDKLTEHISLINQAMIQLPKSVETIKTSIEIDNFFLNEHKMEIYKSIRILNDFHYFLFSFNLRYGHIFNYNFESIEFKKIIETSNNIKSYIQKVRDSIENNEQRFTQQDGEYLNNETKEFFNLIVDFINSLRTEI